MIVGDILHSRVARSNMLLLPRLGARVLLCGPKELLPEQAARSGPGIEIERDFDAALRQSQAVMMLRIQAERLAGLQLDLDEYKAQYQLTGQRLAACAPHALVLHPGPIIRGMEITAGVADGAAVGDSGAGDQRGGHSHGGDGAGAEAGQREAAHDGDRDTAAATSSIPPPALTRPRTFCSRTGAWPRSPVPAS